MNKCFRCDCPKPDDGFHLCESCQKSLVDSIILNQPKRFQGMAERELKRNARSAVK